MSIARERLTTQDTWRGIWRPQEFPPAGAHVVYNLYNGRELVYIGYSANLLRRLSEHERMGKVFTSWTAMQCEDEYVARDVERGSIEQETDRTGEAPYYNRVYR